MSTKSITTTLSVLALLVVSGSASAQLGGLDLSLTPSQGIHGVWALVSPGDNVRLEVRHGNIAADDGLPAKWQIYISTISVLGELNSKTAVLLAQGGTEDGQAFGLKLQIPELDNTAWSLKVVAFYADGSVATSNVLTLIINSFLAGDDPHIDPPDVPSDDPDAGDREPADAVKE